MIIGIQGDEGSGNKRACIEFCKRNCINDYKIKYLSSAENVLKELNEDKINFGTFAVKSRSRSVKETQEAIKKYYFEKIDEVSLEIDYVLLGLKKLNKKEYLKIISHPQALNEHKKYLLKNTRDRHSAAYGLCPCILVRKYQ